jgi:iron complex outermembrane receptor protein
VNDRYYAAIDAVVNPATGQVTCRINLPGQTLIQNFGYIASSAIWHFQPGDRQLRRSAITFRPGECKPLNIVGENAFSRDALDFRAWKPTSSQSVSARTFCRARCRAYTEPSSRCRVVPSATRWEPNIARRAAASLRRPSLSRCLPRQLAALPERGSFNVKEVFAELNLPVFSKAMLADTLSIGGAVPLFRLQYHRHNQDLERQRRLRAGA